MIQANIMLVSEENLRKGMEKRFAYCEQKGQGGLGKWDFHNNMYREIDQQRKYGLTEDFWTYLVEKLWEWKAIRPNPKDEIFEIGRNYLSEMRSEYDLLVPKASGHEAFLNLNWVELRPLFDLAQAIKSSAKPTFPSKLCHFLLPQIYPVWDNYFIGGQGNYDAYWSACHAGWKATDKEPELIMELRKAIIKASGQVYSGFPWATIITELCCSGMK